MCRPWMEAFLTVRWLLIRTYTYACTHMHILLQVHIMFSYTHVRGEPALERWLIISNGDSQLEVLYNLVGTFLLPKLLYVTTGLVTSYIIIIIIILFSCLNFFQ